MFPDSMSEKQKLNFIETAFWILWILLSLSIYIGCTYVADMDSHFSYDDDTSVVDFIQYRYFACLFASWCIGTLLLIYNHFKICRKIDSSY